jgi:hypothetical protein
LQLTLRPIDALALPPVANREWPAPRAADDAPVLNRLQHEPRDGKIVWRISATSMAGRFSRFRAAIADLFNQLA